MEAGDVGLGEAQLLQLEAQRPLVEQAQHHPLPVLEGDGRDAQVDRAPLEPEPDPPILRQAPFREVEAGHDLEPRDDRSPEVGRRGLDRLQYAVDAVAHLQRRPLWLEMDVRGAGLRGTQQQPVDQAHDRRLAGQAPQPRDVVLAHRGDRRVQPLGVTARERLECRLEFGWDPDLDLDVLARRQRQGPGGVGVERVGDRDDQSGRVEHQGQDPVRLKETWSQGRMGNGQDGKVRRAHQREAEAGR